jgi:hypothetical protein
MSVTLSTIARPAGTNGAFSRLLGTCDGIASYFLATSAAMEPRANGRQSAASTAGAATWS